MYPYEISEEEYYNKIINNEILTEQELRYLVGEYEIESDYGDNRRWTRSVSTIVELCNHYYMVAWEEGLTEYQENYYFDQSVEVELIEEEKTIVVKTRNWIPVNKESQHETLASIINTLS